MNTNAESALTPEESQSLLQQDVSEAAREALLSARAAETRRIYALHVRAFGAWLKGEVLQATSINVANYLAGPGSERSHSWRLQAAACPHRRIRGGRPGLARRPSRRAPHFERPPEAEARGDAPGRVADGSGHFGHRGHGYPAQDRPRRSPRVRGPGAGPGMTGYCPYPRHARCASSPHRGRLCGQLFQSQWAHGSGPQPGRARSVTCGTAVALTLEIPFMLAACARSARAGQSVAARLLET